MARWVRFMVTLSLFCVVLPSLWESAAWAQAKPRYQTRSDFSPEGRAAKAIDVGDFNGDGRLDLVVTLIGEDSDPTGAREDSVVVMLADGANPGEFLSPDPSFHRFKAGKPTSGNDTDPVDVLVLFLDAGSTPDIVTANAKDDSITVVANLDRNDTSSVSYDTPGGPQVLAAGDFDGDGDLDVAVACDTAVKATIRVFKNNNGTLSLEADYFLDMGGEQGLAPTGMTLCDFADATPGQVDDLAIVTATDSRLWVLRRNMGNTSFVVAAPIEFDTVKNPVGIECGLMSNDALQDLVVAFDDPNSHIPTHDSEGSKQVTVMLRKTVGDPFEQIRVDTGGNCTAVEVVDVDLDSQSSPDILVVRYLNNFDEERVSFLSYLENRLEFFEGKFLDPVHYHTGLAPFDLVAANLNPDDDAIGFPEIAVPAKHLQTNPNQRPEPAFVSIHVNDEQGLFIADIVSSIDVIPSDPDPNVSTVEAAERIVLGQMNPVGLAGDSHVDAVVIPINVSKVYISLGKGDGSFHEPGSSKFKAVNLGNNRSPRDLTIGNVDGDTDQDIATADVTMDDPDNPEDAGITFLHNKWNGLTQQYSVHTMPAHPTISNRYIPVSVLLVDYTGDGNDDLIVGYGDTDFDPVRAGIFIYKWVPATCNGVICTLDHFDLVTDIPFNTDPPTAPPADIIGGPHDLGAADLDQDGYLDILVCLRGKRANGGPANGTCELGTGPHDLGGFGVIWGNGMAIPPFDTSLDLVGVDSSDPNTKDPRGLIIGDFIPDDDDLLDVALASHCNDSASIYENRHSTGARTFSRHETHRVASFPNNIQAADLNDDGLLDLAVPCYHSNNVAILLQKASISGDEWFTSPYWVGTGIQNYFMGIADIDGDGKLDLVSPSRNSDDIVVALGLGTNP